MPLITRILLGASSLLFLVLGGVLFSGRGFWMITNFSNLPLEARERINEKAICRTVGAFLLILAVAVIPLMGYAVVRAIGWLVIVMTAVILIGIAALMIYLGTGKRFIK